MNNITEVRHMHTRNSARIFGVNITNIPLEKLQEPRKNKAKRSKSSLSQRWLHFLPEVHPYIEEIKHHTRDRQQQSYIAGNFMTWHSDINVGMRQVLMGWLVEVQSQLCFNHHTLYLATLIIDKYCHNRFIARSKYQLLGITSLFVAAKFEEVRTPKLKRYYEICGGQYSSDQIIAMESQILVALNFKIKAMTNCWHLEQYIQFAGIQSENKLLSLYILDLSLIQFNFCLIRPTLLTWSIILYVIKARSLRDLSQIQISQYFQIEQSELKESLDFVMDLYRNRRLGKFKSVNQKYLFQIGHIIA